MSELQGWYRADNETPRLRVRISVEGRSLTLHELAGALLLIVLWAVG